MKRLRPYLLPTLLVLLVFAVYANSLNNGFVSDDIPGIVQSGASWTWKSVFTSIIFLTHWTGILQFFIYQIVGLTPWAYRLVNILCHAISVLLVYKIVFQLSRPPLQVPDGTWLRQQRIAFVASSLFAVHPIIIESVTWISGGVYAQYGMLFLLSFWLYLKSRELEALPAGRQDRVLRIGVEGRRLKVEKRFLFYLLASYSIYFIALFFSEKAAVLFLLFFLYEWCFESRPSLRWRKLMPYFIASCIFMLFYITQLNSRIASVSQVSGGGEGGMYNPLIQLPIALSSYFYLIIWPKDLTLYHEEVPIVGTADYVFRVLTVCMYIFGIAFTAVKNRKLCFWLLWFLIPLLPTLTPLKISWLVAERYAYLSVIGIFVLIAYGFEWVLNQHHTIVRALRSFFLRSSIRLPFKGDTLQGVYHFGVWIVILCIYLALIMRTVVRNQDWYNEDSLWIATAKTSPLIPFTWNNMGDVYSRRGDLKKAAEMFQRAIVLNPQYADAYHNLAETYRDMGETGDAILMYEKAFVFNPNLWQSHGALAEIYYNKKDYQKALFHIEEALKIVPDNQMLLRARDQIRKMQKW